MVVPRGLMPRFTRLANAFSKKVENHKDMLATDQRRIGFDRLIEPKSILDGLKQIAYILA
jgi:hypothetical protein